MRRPFRLGRPERDVDDELAFHIAERERALIAAGEEPGRARSRALERFGDLSRVRAECLTIDRDRDRARRWGAVAGSLRQDAGYGLRRLRRQPGFTLIVLLIIAIGIGTNTAIFSLIDALLLRPLPVPHPEQLVAVGDPRQTASLSLGLPQASLLSYPVFADLRDQTRTLRGVYASGYAQRLDVVRGRGGDVTHPRGRFVSGSFFTVLGVPAFVGRTFTAAEDRTPGGDPVVVLSYGYWARAFAADRGVIGGTLSVNGVPLTIVGVAPPDFAGDVIGQASDLWIPVMMQPSLMPHTPWLSDRSVSWLLVMGRLAPGVSLAAARTELTALVARSLLEHATATDHDAIEHALRAHATPVASGARGFSYYRDAYRTALLTLMAAVGLVLLVVCANVANLLLARAVAQVREISVRMAIGAGRWRLVQLALTESLLLAVGGAALGLAVAVLGSRALLRMGTGVTLAAGLDGRVLAFTAALSLGTAILVGTLPAFRGTRLALATALRTQGRSVSGPSLVLGRYLVVAQVALSMTLVVGAGMLARSTIHLAHADVGVARDNLLIATIDAQRAGYTGPRLLALMRDLTGRALAVPGVAAATLSEDGLFNGRYAGTTVQIGGFSARADSDTTVAEDAVGPGYFHAVGAHILRGRDIDAHDNETAPRVAVVNASFAHFFFPRGDALGQHVLADSATWEIVGIVADIRQNGIRDAPARRLYVPIFQATEGVSEFRVVVRAEGDPARLTAAVQGALSAPDPSVAVLDVEPLDSLIGSTIQGDRLVATMVSLFGVLALVLAALGLYGVTAYTTVRRTAEFGLRLALGAAPAAVARMVLREAALLTGLGIAIGLTVALAAAHLVEAQLYGIGLFDPPSVGLAIVVLGLSGTLAACLPASRAMRIAPLDAIHTE